MLFVVWLLSFIDYYFYIFFEESSIYIKVLLNVQLNSFEDINSNTVKTSLQNITFALTEEAHKRGYKEKMLPALIQVWTKLANLDVYFS